MVSTGALAPTSQAFFAAVLQKLGLPVTPSNLDALYSVEHLEGDNQRFNPLNVIQPEPGSSNYNSVGVQSYASFDTGVQGTATLLSNSHWTGVRAALARGSSVSDVLSAFQAAYTWDPGVSFPATSSIWDAEAGRTVGGASATVPGNYNTSAPGASSLSNPITSAVSSVGSSILKPIIMFVLKMGFVAGGIVLVLLGAWQASRPARQDAASLAPLAAAAA